MKKLLNIVEDSFTNEFKSLTRHTELSENYFIQRRDILKKVGNLKTFIDKGEKFIYPLYIGQSNLFLQDIPTPPLEVQKEVRNNKGVILFLYLNEGNFYKDRDIKLVEDWCKSCSFTKDNVYFFTSNLLINNIKSKHISFVGLNYFESHIWHIPSITRDFPNRVENYRSTELTKYQNKVKVKTPHTFLSLNRQPRDNRIFLATLLKSCRSTSAKTLLSLGNEKLRPQSFDLSRLPFNLDVIKDIRDLKNISEYVSHTFNELKKGLYVDIKNLQKINTHSQFEELFNTSSISIITETETDNRTIFFSEKTFRPITAFHPFFLIGSKNSLKHLRSLGYKTFSKWWDESYDNYDNVYDRIYYAFKEIQRLSYMNQGAILEIIKDMEPTLIHNFNNFFDNPRFGNEFKTVYK